MGAGSQRGKYGIEIRIRGHHRHLNIRVALSDYPSRLNAIEHGHTHIHQNDIRFDQIDLFYRFSAVSGLAHDLIVLPGLNYQFEPGSHNLFVFDDHNFVGRREFQDKLWTPGQITKCNLPLRSFAETGLQYLEIIVMNSGVILDRMLRVWR